MKRFDPLLKKHFHKVYLLVLLCAAVVYGVFSMNRLIWADEAYTFALMGHSFGEIWTITAADVHPPLFYFYLKVLSSPFGYNLHVCRFLSALPCIALMAVAGWQLRRLFSERLAVLFMALYLLFPYTMDYAVEVRMYSLAEFFLMVCAIWGYRCWLWNKGRDWAVFALAGTAAALCHYFALVSAAMVYMLLFFAAFRKKSLFKGWLLASAATVVLYLPWLGCFVMQLMVKVNNEYWIEPITLSTVIGYVKTVLSANAFSAAPLFQGCALAAAFVILLLQKNRERTMLCLWMLVIPLGTVAVGLAASFLVRPVFVIRYLLPSVPFVVLFYAFVLSEISDEMVFTLLLSVSLMAGVSNMAYQAKHAVIPDQGRLSAQLVDSFPEHSAYVVIPDFSLHPGQEIAYYEPETPVYVPDALGADNPYRNRMPIGGFDAQSHERIILVTDAFTGVPGEYQVHYQQEYLCTVVITGAGYDLWYLTAK